MYEHPHHNQDNDFEKDGDRIDICGIFKQYKGDAPFRFYCRIRLKCNSDSPDVPEAVNKFLSGVNRELKKLALPEITTVALINKDFEDQRGTIHFMIGRAEDMMAISYPLLYMIISNSMSAIDVDDLFLYELGKNLYLERIHGPSWLFC